MRNLSQRVKRVEEKLGMKDQRFILILSCADPNERLDFLGELGAEEITPGRHYALLYGPPLTAVEREELRDKYSRRDAD